MQDDFIRPDIIIYFLDMVGVVACAIAGTLLAQSKGMDISGGILVAMVNAIGGGTLRDLVLDRHPLFWMTDINYLLVITITSVAAQTLFHLRSKITNALRVFDAIGLAAFSVIGLKVALAQGATAWIAVMMAVWTAIFGGLIRDIICNEIPLVFQREIYISACVCGSVLYIALDSYGINKTINEFAMLVTIFLIRMAALRYCWKMPSMRLLGQASH